MLVLTLVWWFRPISRTTERGAPAPQTDRSRDRPCAAQTHKRDKSLARRLSFLYLFPYPLPLTTLSWQK
jgi:hypothetical protein